MQEEHQSTEEGQGGGSEGYKRKRINNPNGARGTLKCPECRRKKQKCVYVDAEGSCDGCTRSGHQCAGRTHTLARLAQFSNANRPHHPPITSYPASNASPLHMGANSNSSTVWQTPSLRVSQIAVGIEQQNSARAHDVRFINDQLQQYLRPFLQQDQSSDASSHRRHSGGHGFQPGSSSESATPSPHSRQASGDRSGTHDFGSQQPTTPQEGNPPQDPNADPDTPSNNPFQPSHIWAGPHAHHQLNHHLPNPALSAPSRISQRPTSSIQSSPQAPPLIQSGGGISPFFSPTNSSEMQVNQQLYFEDGRVMWVNFVEQPIPGTGSHGSPQVGLVDSLPTEPPRPTPPRHTSQEDSGGAQSATATNPLDRFLELDS